MYKYFLIGAFCLFAVIGGMGMLKRKSDPTKITTPVKAEQMIEEISLVPLPPPSPPPAEKGAKAKVPTSPFQPVAGLTAGDDLPDANRVGQLFAKDSSRLPYVETLSYTSRVPWLEGRPAWISDYASQYETSRHFIARSLNQKPDYTNQKISPGDRFNVFRRDKKIGFHLLIDLSRCRMWFYCLDLNANERLLLKTYRVGLGRLDPHKPSGSLTPVGTYSLGEKVAIYKPGTMGFFQDQKTEMIRIFGTRWIPFENEIEGCSEPAKALGLHGAPWIFDTVSGNLIEDRSKIGKYESDGCIRMAQEDIEELFSIIITKPTQVELVKDFREAKLPGIERSFP